MGNLTGMYKALGSPENRHPARWLRSPQAEELIATITSLLNVPSGTIVTTRQGRYGGTWARYELALAYAQYLSPAFYVNCNRFLYGVFSGGIFTELFAELRSEVAELRTRVDALESVQATQRPLKALPEPVQSAVLRWYAQEDIASALPLLASQCGARYNAWAARVGAPLLSVTAVSKALVGAGVAYRQHTAPGNRLCSIGIVSA